MVLFGLDFGTTFSTICVYNDSRVHAFNQQNSAYIPTYLFLHNDKKNMAFGYDAEALAANPLVGGGFFRDLKRWVGCDEDNIDEYRNSLKPHYSVTLSNFGVGSRKCVVLGCYSGTTGMTANLPSLIALFVRSLVVAASKSFGVECSGVICSVPANYNCLQRSFTEHCITLSGFKCVHMVNEPSAAALSVCSKLPLTPQNLIVYDFGGGTFDVSVLLAINQMFVVRASGGDINLGGRDVDRAFGERLYQMAKLPFNPEFDVSHLKESFSKSAAPVSYTLISPDGRDREEILVTPSILSEVMVPFIERTIKIMSKVYESYVKTTYSTSGTNVKAKLILVGGSSYLPGLASLLGSVDFVSECVDISDARAAVAAGCALFSSCLTNQSSMMLVDCASHNLSIPGYSGESIVVVPAGAPIPFDGSRNVSIRGATATSIFRTGVLEGDFTKCVRNKLIFRGEVVMGSLGYKNTAPLRVDVTLEIKISSVGTVSFAIKGADGQAVTIGDQTAYDFSNVRLPERSVEDLHERNSDRVLLWLSLTRFEKNRRALSPADKVRLKELLIIENIDETLKSFGSYDEQSASVCRVLLGTPIQKVLRGSRVEEVPL